MNCTKRSYATKGEAKLALRNIRSYRRHAGCAQGKPPENHAYRCPFCNQWHLTSWSIWKSMKLVDQIRAEARG